MSDRMSSSDEAPTPAPSTPALSLDAYSPDQIAERVELQGVYKSRLSPAATMVLALLGGGFIGLGAMFQTVILADPALNPGLARIFGGIAFSMGYLISTTAGAEVFTSNNLTVMSWAARKLSTRMLLRNWVLVFAGNALGAGGLALVLVLSGHMYLHEGRLAQAAIDIAVSKSGESFVQAFFAGVVGNLLICIGVWIAMAGRSVVDRFFAPMLPISALAIAGFEHCVGNIYYICSGLLMWVAHHPPLPPADILAGGAIHNLIAVSCGNIVAAGCSWRWFTT